MLRPDHGHVFVGEQDLYALPSAARARERARSIGFVFQQFHLTPYLNVIENVLSAAIERHSRPHAENLLARFGLARRMLHLPSQLSSGERQRTALARALINQPRLILADEPTGNLDHENGAVVLTHLQEYVKEGGALLLVTHDPHAARCAQRSLVLGK
jgi:ABC-type lipoprotein export system ATPase subunit